MGRLGGYPQNPLQVTGGGGEIDRMRLGHPYLRTGKRYHSTAAARLERCVARLSRLVALLLCSGIVAAPGIGCRPYRPPPEAPPLAVARGPVRVVVESGAGEAVNVVVRAGSAYDPPSREGLAFVLAKGLATAGGATVEVGPEVVVFRAPARSAPALLRVLSEPVNDVELAAGKAAALATLRGNDCESIALTVGATWIEAGHPYGHAVAGRTSVIPTLTLGELQGFRSLRYVRDAVVVGVDGAAEVPSFDAAFAPALSMPVTPAVRSRVPREDAVVNAAVSRSCFVVGPRRLEAWSAEDEAVARVSAELWGVPPPPALVDPWFLAVHFHNGEPPSSPVPFPGVMAPEAVLGARDRVRASLSVPSSAAVATDLLLGSIRRSTHVPKAEVLAALDALTPASFAAARARLLGDDPVSVYITPEPLAPEAIGARRVFSSEELLR